MTTWRSLRDNPDAWKRYFVRETVLRAIRSFFVERKFHEVETPLLVGSLPPESYLDVFETTAVSRTGKRTQAFLPTSPEPFLKKLLAAGIGNCFTLTKSFRNSEDMSMTHVHEFTILEWYREQADYTAIMDDVEELVCSLVDVIYPDISLDSIPYNGSVVNMTRPWKRVSVCEAFQQYADIDLTCALTREDMENIAKQKGYAPQNDDTWEMMFNQIFLNEIEPFLGKGSPVILYDYPVELAALSRKKPSDPRFAERFEFYILGLELGDAYSELTDWKEQQARFESEEVKRKEEGKTEHPIDYDMIEALKVGIPPCGGIALGVDRLIMFLSDTTDIKDTLFFPPQDLFDSKASE
jgi:elongation factor P--(R)-beta-lysine ligase